MIQTTINLTDLFLAEWNQESLSLRDFNLENMHKCNIIFSDLDYFLKCYWTDSRPIVNSKPTWVNPFRQIKLHNWTISFCRRSSTPSAVWNHPQGTQRFTESTSGHQRANCSLCEGLALGAAEPWQLQSVPWLGSSVDGPWIQLGQSATDNWSQKSLPIKMCRRHMLYCQLI